MRAVRFAFLLLALCAVVSAAACSSDNSTTTPTSIAKLSITGSSPAIGGTSQFTATATLLDGTVETVTDQATWSSSNTSIATVSTTGVVKGVGGGTAMVTASFDGVSVSQQVTI